MDFFLGAASPVRWKGPMDVSPVWLGLMEMNVIREFLADVVWGELDYLLADLPPGAAADKPPVMAGFIPDLAGAIVVTTPSEVASDVVQKSVTYARDMGIKVLGIVENMSEYRCPSCGEFFCRECVSEHDGKLLCASCLARSSTTSARKRERRAVLRRVGAAAAGGLALWIAFYGLGSLLAKIPADFHDGTIWKKTLDDAP